MADDPLVVFTPSGKRGRFPAGTPVLTAARQLGVVPARARRTDRPDQRTGGARLCGVCAGLRIVAVPHGSDDPGGQTGAFRSQGFGDCYA